MESNEISSLVCVGVVSCSQSINFNQQEDVNGKVSDLVRNEKQTEGRNDESFNYLSTDHNSPLSSDDHNSSDSFVDDQLSDDVAPYPVEDFHGSQEPV